MKKHKNGFTLAEVLITLVIIGIIAAMTIPSLMNKTNEQETVVAVKKAYSTLSQAYQQMVAENGELNPSYFGSTKQEATKNFGDIFTKYLNVQKNCGMSTDGDCWSEQNGGVYKHFNGTDWYNFNNDEDKHYKLRLADGSSLALLVYAGFVPTCGESIPLKSVFGYLHIDVNGDKLPNTAGKDVFSFWLTKYGFVPIGSQYDTKFPLSTCYSTSWGCTAWVVTKGNMDYLRKDVSW